MVRVVCVYVCVCVTTTPCRRIEEVGYGSTHS